MATKGKKQTTKKKGSGTKTAKKPASFSKDASKKKTDDSKGFSEFETFDVKVLKESTKKTPSKIILRDVEKEAKVEVKEEKVEKATAEVVLPKAEKKGEQSTRTPKISAKEIKEKEISKAIKAASKIENEKPVRKKKFFGDFGWGRAILVIACAATSAFAIIYFVHMASTDMSIKVAAMQSGIDANYPTYIPRDYTLSDVSSSNGKIVMNFKKEAEEFQIVEENSNWDSDALLNNYIKEKYGNAYTVVKEQGLTLYMGDTWEAWVNGGILYKLTVNSGELTKKQMRSIAASL